MKRALIFALCVFSLWACAGREAKPPSPDSAAALEAFSLAEEIKEAYLSGDMKTIEKKSTADGYREMVGAVRKFDSALLDFTPRWVEIKGEDVELNVSWTGKWTSGGETVEKRGMAVFLFEGRPLRLKRIIKGNPFIYPQ